MTEATDQCTRTQYSRVAGSSTKNSSNDPVASANSNDATLAIASAARQRRRGGAASATGGFSAIGHFATESRATDSSAQRRACECACLV